EHAQLGEAKRVVARALALNPNDGSAQQFLVDVQARIRIRRPEMIRELESDLARASQSMDRDNYLQLREKIIQAKLMVEPGDARIVDLRRRLNIFRPQPQ